jgi:hypothetical protein
MHYKRFYNALEPYLQSLMSGGMYVRDPTTGYIRVLRLDNYHSLARYIADANKVGEIISLQQLVDEV